MSEVPYHIRAAGKAAEQHYLKMLAEGQTPRFAEMCALQCPPGVKGTDRAVMQGRLNGEWLDQMPKHQAQRILAEAKSAGINPSGKYYQSGLADKRGPSDPAAWIDSAADIKKVAQARNLHVTGIVEHKAHDVPPPPPVALSDRVIRKLMPRYKNLHPGKKAGELREMIVQNHAPKHKRAKA
jgi:hypothetical protein